MYPSIDFTLIYVLSHRSEFRSPLVLVQFTFGSEIRLYTELSAFSPQMCKQVCAVQIVGKAGTLLKEHKDKTLVQKSM